MREDRIPAEQIESARLNKEKNENSTYLTSHFATSPTDGRAQCDASSIPNQVSKNSISLRNPLKEKKKKRGF